MVEISKFGLLVSVISDTYEHFDALTACFPWCTTTTARCIPRGSRSISLEPHVKSLHLTLAYQFPSNQYNSLKTLVEELDSSSSGEWELRLYSRDPRLNGKDVYKVVSEYTPSDSEYLELKIGDYLYVSSGTVSGANDGWLEGTSWSTGCSGFFPESYTERSPESDAWTLHRNIPLNTCQNFGTDSRKSEDDMGDNASELEKLSDFVKQKLVTDLKDVDALSSRTALSDPNTRKIFIMRHGERVDFVFGTWVPYCFDATGNYIRKDLNMPPVLPLRSSGPEGFLHDSPLTNIGLFQAKSMGEVFKLKDISIEHVYSSPSFRCLQTCDAFLEGLGKKEEVKIRVEPALFELVSWYPENVINWMSPAELSAAGFNIDTDYTPFMNEKAVNEPKESIERYYERSAAFTSEIVASHPTGNILIIGHASTLDTCSRDLLQLESRDANGLIKFVQNVPYCSLATLTFDGKSWTCSDPPCIPMTHSTNKRFDWKILLPE